MSPIEPTPIRAADLPLEKLASNSHVSQQDKVAEVSRQFEAALLRQILAQTQKPVFTSTFNQDSFAAGIYRDTVCAVLADTLSASGSFGLAQSLTPTLARQLP